MWTLNIYQRPKISGAQVATDVNVKASDIDDQEHSIGVEVVVHERKGAYGGSGLVKKPSNAKNGASNLPVPKQPDLKQCGFFVLQYMRCIFEFEGSVDMDSMQSLFKEKIYYRDQIDEMRVEWAECIQREI
ncbi:hypothetical protein ACS0TY_032621 [Phlomoides rotata]